MTSTEIFEQIKHKSSYLCVGLDTDLTKIPEHLLDDPNPIFAFNKAIIDATVAYTVAYKPNLAFYEKEGKMGWHALELTVAYLRVQYPKLFIIADAKRGDIGNTSTLYAEAFFNQMDFDAITLSPYMGEDTVAPFLKFKNKWSILLALTSNPSAENFQLLQEQASGKYIYEKVLETSKNWGTTNSLMYVVGATKSEFLQKVRAIVPDHFLLIPGVGEQGGNLKDVAKHGMNKQCGLLVNSSRAIIYASQGIDFAEQAAYQAQLLQREMSETLNNRF